MREPEIDHHISTDEAFERQGRDHVQAKTQSCDVDEQVVGGEIVEDVAERAVAESEETCQSHCETGKHGYCS